jgi:3-hydroxy-3-methylglutaryl CoA synthase
MLEVGDRPVTVVDGCGGYVPYYRIERETIAAQQGGRGRGETAVPGRDENHVTMACEAASVALERSDVDGAALDAVFTASVSDPFAEHGIASHVAYRLGTSRHVRVGDFGGSPRAGTDALSAAQEFVIAREGAALVVGVDLMPAEAGAEGERDAGAGAGAVVVCPDAEDPTAVLEATGCGTTGFVERHRSHGEPPVTGDEKYERSHGVPEAADAALTDAGTTAETGFDRAVVAVPSRRMVRAATANLDDPDVQTTYEDVGYVGAASFYLDLAATLESAGTGERIVALSYGAGGAGAMSMETGSGVGSDLAATVATQVEQKEYVTYAEHLEQREDGDYRGVVVP